MVTTESATAAATLANCPRGCSGSSLVSSVTFDVVNAWTISAVLRPTRPPTTPMTSATMPSTASATQDTLPPNSTSRTPSFPTTAVVGAGRSARTPENPTRRRSRGCATDRRARRHPFAFASSAPASVGCRCSESPPHRDGRTPRPGRGRGPGPSGCTPPVAILAGTGEGSADAVGPPNARLDAGSTGGRETGRGSRRPDRSGPVGHPLSPSIRASAIADAHRCSNLHHPTGACDGRAARHQRAAALQVVPELRPARGAGSGTTAQQRSRHRDRARIAQRRPRLTLSVDLERASGHNDR